jgi:phage/plasmid-associated DNA primase
MPKLRNVDDAIKRRMHMIPFLFKPSVVNTQLEEQLEAEWPGILHWMIEGCLEWQRIGLRRPAVVEEATEEYLGGEDLIGRWLEERCPQEPGAFTLTQDLFEDWQEWCAGNGEKPGTKITFGRALSGGASPRRGRRIPTGPLVGAASPWPCGARRGRSRLGYTRRDAVVLAKFTRSKGTRAHVRVCKRKLLLIR